MKSLLKKVGLSLFLLLFLFPQPVLAQSWGDCLEPIDVAGEIYNVPTIKCFEVIFRNILNIAVELAVVVLFIFLVIGGFKFITSGGDPKATESAKNTLTYAILGLVLLIGIWLILNFIEYFTGIEVTVFKIGI
jgi:hypothetical protein